MSKRVRFKLEPQIHLMCVWNFAYKSSRRGPWETYAIDRFRFQRRIYEMNKMLQPILDQDHRNKIYKARFEK